jgi:glycosyltransferase involved in cell wall biosynthesis
LSGQLVSVFTATYNGAEFVGETIESVLAQTYEPVEHVLVDDGSTDGTADVLTDYERRYADRIRVVRGSGRLGPCRRRNEAIGATTGPLLAWLDHDDVWLPRKLELQVAALEEEPQAAFCYTQFEEFAHETGENVSRSNTPAGDDLLEQLFVQGCFIASSTVLFRRDEFERKGGRLRESEFSFGDDYSLWLSLLTDRRAVLVDDVLVRLRRHARNESARLARENYERRVLPLLDEFVASHPERATALGSTRRRGYARHWAAAAEWELTRGSRSKTAVYAARAALLDPAGAAQYAGARVRRRLRRR